jgi:hypothetical protein
MLVGSGIPSGGNLTRYNVVFAPKVEFGAFVYGSGQGALPIPSPDCQVQVAPLLPGAAVFFTDQSGRASLNIAIPVGLPAGDVFLQAGILGFGEFVLTNPLQIHIR